MRQLIFTGALLAASAAAAAAQPSSTRFQAMDTNRDGRITRDEWRGNARAFARHDWNNDGVLSGDELLAGNNRRRDQSVIDEAGITDWTESHFRQLDRNADNRIARAEWQYDVQTFSRVDRNRDDVISRAEFLGLDLVNEPVRDRIDTRGERFEDLDTNNDNRITRREWRDSDDAFRWLDRDNNGVLTRAEVTGAGGRDGRIRREASSQAYRTGYDRGLAEGREAGREDKRLRNTWDLDGQRELEQADSGYQSHMGDRGDYQQGYRAGFVAGYGEGFGRRN
jgi:hypothetical protein